MGFVTTWLHRAGAGLRWLGLHPDETADNLRGLARYVRDWRALRAQLGPRPDFPITKLYPALRDRTGGSGVASGHYFHQDLWVAQRIFANQPGRHVDVGSRIDGFVAHVATFRELTVYDIRPLRSPHPNIRFAQHDLMNLPGQLHATTDSLSCLHTLEHLGLGRYGDPIDARGHEKGLRALWHLLRPGGTLYVSVPMGPQRTEFNAHRVFGAPFLFQWLAELFRIDQFAYVDDAGDLHTNVVVTDELLQRHFGCYYGCALFELTKLPATT